jgi:exosortase A
MTQGEPQASNAMPVGQPKNDARRNEWLRTVGVLLVALTGIVVLFYPTAESIVSIWQRSETFAHGFLIAPISLWLVWEKRHGLTRLVPRPAFLPTLLLLPLGSLWLLANLVDVLVVQQFAFVGMLIVAIWSILGHSVARYLAFPIGFLLFGVPVGEGLIYPMMNFTADFTVGMLKLTGIPVYREGTFFTIPSGRWSVVEACSGVRYLIASVTLGALFAYLTYTRWWKRGLFMLVAIVVPIIANGLRAYLIVMIGHLSDMKLAVGVDHLIYGWVFFGIVVTIMFVIGSFWRDPPREDRAPRDHSARRGDSMPRWRTLGAVLVLSGLWPALGWALADERAAVLPVTLVAPLPVSGWTLGAEPEPWNWRPRIRGTDGSLYAFYRKSDVPVGLYLGIYRTQRQGSELVSSSNVMVPPTPGEWSDSSIRLRTVKIANRELRVEQHRLMSRSGQRLLVWSFFRVGNRYTAEPYVAKVIEAMTRLRGSRGEAALLAVAAPYEERLEYAETVLLDFIDSMLDQIDGEINQAVSR